MRPILAFVGPERLVPPAYLTRSNYLTPFNLSLDIKEC